MRYNLLLKSLRFLMYVKRFIWWLGRQILRGANKTAGLFFRPFIYVRFKLAVWLKRFGIEGGREWLWKRDFLQIIIFLILLIAALPHSRLLAKPDPLLVGKKTIAYRLVGPGEEGLFEEVVVVEEAPSLTDEIPSWRTGSVESPGSGVGRGLGLTEQDLAPLFAGGSALGKPIINPGSSLGRPRDRVVEYVVEPGDSLGAIAYQFGVSVTTLMWENNLTLRSLIRPGDIIRVPPVDGILHTIKKGDTLKRIASLYDVKAEEIVAFNHLKEDGSNLVIGERLMIPGGTRIVDRASSARAQSTSRIQQLARQRALPPASTGARSVAGFVWPSGARAITQYFGLFHHALDIAGPWQTPTYAAKSGVVETSQCGWNNGYGCYVIINHGGGLKTLYAHHSKLLVSAGEEVQTGQAIALMGNSGKVRGKTGIHVHFEVIVNGRRVNPLGYVR